MSTEILINKLKETQVRNPIKLNIGGQIFVTTIDTLTSFDNTYFKVMFSDKWVPLLDDRDNSYFIDRDPFVFPFILKFLRSGTINLKLLTPQQREYLTFDAEFYQIEPLIRILNPNSELLKINPISEPQESRKQKDVVIDNAQLNNKKADYDYLLKILLVGNAGVGKSCINLQYTDKKFFLMNI